MLLNANIMKLQVGDTKDIKK